MITKVLSTTKAGRAFVVAAAMLTPAIIAGPAQAGFLHHHHKMAGIAAGLAAHHMAKHSGGHGFMHRHPIMTGLAAGAATNHMLKR